MKKYLITILFVIPMIMGIASAQTVYVTNSGKKYHAEGCTYLKSKNAIELSDAKNKGYTACSKCSPDNSVNSEISENQDSTTTEKKEEPKEVQKPTTTSKGYEIQTGPRGGRYHYSKSGKKVYERR